MIILLLLLLLMMTSLNITETYIQLFNNNDKQLKKDNDANNKIRENIIYSIIKKQIPNEWYEKNIKWYNLKTKLLEIFNLSFYNDDNNYDNIDIELKGGRKYNYDFELIFLKNNEIINKECIEFKYNSFRIDKYPQFLSVSANKFIKGIDYAEYFYDNYISDISKLINTTIPDKSNYMKYIYNNDYNKLTFFSELKKKENLIIKEKKEIVSKSIKNYLTNYLILDIEMINKFFQEKQLNKHYILYHNDKFYYDSIKKEELEIIGIETIKNNNCLILNTNSNTKIEMLLRWKNHIGILYPAWQISLSRFRYK